jgi:hypothetical protein
MSTAWLMSLCNVSPSGYSHMYGMESFFYEAAGGIMKGMQMSDKFAKLWLFAYTLL